MNFVFTPKLNTGALHPLVEVFKIPPAGEGQPREPGGEAIGEKLVNPTLNSPQRMSIEKPRAS